MNYYNPNLCNLEQYVVKQGDSLYMIAKKYGITVDELKSTNHLVSNMIYPNQILFIPRKKCSNVVKPNDCVKPNPNLSKPNECNPKPNDCITGLIEKYNYTLYDLNDINFVENKMVSNRYGKVHICDPGEKIEDILAKYQISPLALLKYNENKLIVPGKEIIVG